MRGKGKENIKTAVISIVVAVLVWMAINYINPPELTTTIYNLPVRITGMRQLEELGLTVVGRKEISGLSVSVKGKRNDLLKLSGGIYVDVDVSGVTREGEHNLTGNVTLPSTRLTIDRVRFNSVPVKIEKIESKDIKIKVKQTGSLGGKLVEMIPDTETVTITGAKSEIEEVKYGEATINISELTEDTVIETEFVLMNEKDSPVSKSETIEASHTKLNVNSVIYDSRSVPVQLVINENFYGADKIDLNASTITPSVIEIGVKPHTEIDCVFVNITEKKEELECKVTVPEGAYIPKENQKVKIELAEIEENDLTLEEQ